LLHQAPTLTILTGFVPALLLVAIQATLLWEAAPCDGLRPAAFLTVMVGSITALALDAPSTAHPSTVSYAMALQLALYEEGMV